MTGGSVVTVRDVKPSLRAEIVSSPIRLTRLFIIDDLISGYTHISTSDQLRLQSFSFRVVIEAN
jgi:hypothetical protein